jgi:hypothetical protein
MTKSTLVLVWGALCLAIGCGGASGMDRGEIPVAEIRREAPPESSEPYIDDSQIGEELARYPQLPGHARVAVYFVPAAEPAVPWRWSIEERQQVIHTREGEHELDLFLLPASAVSGNRDIRAIRLAAAHYGADAVISVTGSYEQRRSENGWAATYALLLPILFAPAQEQTTVFVAEAHMIDVRNGYLYLAAEGEATQSQQRAHLWVRADEAIEYCRREAVNLLTRELGERIVRSRPAHLFRDPPQPSAPPQAPTQPAPQDTSVLVPVPAQAS